jgi:hypothetical protein
MVSTDALGDHDADQPAIGVIKEGDQALMSWHPQGVVLREYRYHLGC